MNIIKKLPEDIKLYINSFVPQKHCVSCYKKIFIYSNKYLIFCSIRCRYEFYFLQFKMFMAVSIISIYMLLLIIFVHFIPIICILFIIILILHHIYIFITI